MTAREALPQHCPSRRDASPRLATGFAARLAQIGRRPTLMRCAAVVLGVAMPGTTAVMRDLLPFFAIAVAVFGILSLDISRISLREAVTVALMVAVVAIASPVAALGLGSLIRLPPDLVLAAVLIAAAPVAFSSGIQSLVLGLPQRPPTWTALIGLLTAPVVLPALAALSHETSLFDPMALAHRAVLFGLLPAAMALALRRIAPRPIACILPQLRSCLVLSLLPVAFAMGSTLREGAQNMPTDFLIGAAVAAGTLAMAAVMAACLGRALLGKRNGLAFAVIATTRNGSFAWAAVIGVLSPRADLAFCVTVVVSFISPVLLNALGRLKHAGVWLRRRPRDTRPARHVLNTPERATTKSEDIRRAEPTSSAPLRLCHARLSWCLLPLARIGWVFHIVTVWRERDRMRSELAFLPRGMRQEMLARDWNPDYEASKPFWRP